MKEDIKTEWVTALRSGNYSQSAGILRDDRGFCCLGVLCDLAVKAGVATSIESAIGEGTIAYLDKDALPGSTGDVAYLPQSVMKWAGLTASNPQAGDDYLSSLNDNGFSFEKIADVIEKEL